MNKEIYTTPEMEVCEFEIEDVITTSGAASLNNAGFGGTPTEVKYTELF